VGGIDALGFGIVLPFLVFVVNDFGGNAVAYGVLAATYPAFQLVGAPFLGRWSDERGRRPMLLVSEIGTALAWALFAVAMLLPVIPLLTVRGVAVGRFTLTLPLVMLFLSRACDGLTGGNVSVANAYVADVTSEDDRSAAFGKMGVASSLGFVIGPAIAGLMGKRYLAAVLMAFALSCTATLVILYRLPESLPRLLRKHPNRARPAVVFGMEPRPCVRLADEPEKRWRDAWRVPHVPWLLMLYFTAYAGFTVFQAAFPAHAATDLGWTVRQTGVLFTVLSLTLALVQGRLTAPLAKRFGNAKLIVAGAAVLGVSLVLFTLRSSPALYAAAVFYGAGTGLMWPPLLAVIANVAGDEHQGAVQGLAGSAGGMASTIGLVLGGVLYSWIGGSTFYVAAVLIFASGAMGLRVLTFVTVTPTAPPPGYPGSPSRLPPTATARRSSSSD
jgi:MFS family permease